MVRDWETKFESFIQRERAAFRKVEDIFYKLSSNAPMADMDEYEQAYTTWQATTKALADFLLDFHAQRTKLGHR